MKQSILLVVLLVPAAMLISQESSSMTLFRSGQYRQAITAANAVLEDDPSNMQSFSIIGWSYLNLKQWKSAIDIAQQAIKFNKNDPRIIQILGESYYELDEDELAIEYISKYITGFPRGQFRSWMYFYLGEIYRKQGKLHKADIAYSTAIHQKNDRPLWWLALALLRETQGYSELARDAYLKVLSLDDANSIARKKILQYNQN